MAGILGVTTAFLMGSVWNSTGTKPIAYAKSITVAEDLTGKCGEGVTYIFLMSC